MIVNKNCYLDERTVLKFKSKVLVRMLWIMETHECSKDNWNAYEIQKSIKNMINADLKEFNAVRKIVKRFDYKIVPLCIN